MAQINVNIRIDEDLKRDFENLCNNLGLTVTVAFNVFARAVVRRQKIPFEISMDAYNAETAATLDEIEQMKKRSIIR